MAADFNNGTARLTWVDPGDETGIEVQYAESPTGDWIDVPQPIPPNQTEAFFATSAGQDYFYRIRSLNASPDPPSDWTDPVSPETTRDDVIRLTATFEGNTPILHFQDDTRFLRFDFFRKPLEGSTWDLLGSLTREPGPANPAGYSIPMDPLTPGAAYEFRVVAAMDANPPPGFPPERLVYGYAYVGTG